MPSGHRHHPDAWERLREWVLPGFRRLPLAPFWAQSSSIFSANVEGILNYLAPLRILRAEAPTQWKNALTCILQPSSHHLRDRGLPGGRSRPVGANQFSRGCGGKRAAEFAPKGQVRSHNGKGCIAQRPADGPPVWQPPWFSPSASAPRTTPPSQAGAGFEQAVACCAARRPLLARGRVRKSPHPSFEG